MAIYSSADVEREIDNGRLVIERDGDVHVEPSSVDVHLGESFVRFGHNQLYNNDGVVDPRDRYTVHQRKSIEGTEDNPVVIDPSEFMLAHTQERVEIPETLVAFLHGRSSVGRLGLFIHNAGLVDAGFEGDLTLELYNASPNPIVLPPGWRVGQMTFHEHLTPPIEAYNSQSNKYQGQSGVTVSRSFQDTEFEE